PVPLYPLPTTAVWASGVTATLSGSVPTVMSAGFLVLVFTSIVDTELPLGEGVAPKLELVTKAVLPSGAIATPFGLVPSGMSAGFLLLVLTLIVDTVPLPLLVTNAALPSGVIATPNGAEPTGMSVGFLVLVFTSIVETEPPPLLLTKPVFPSAVIPTPTRSSPPAL